MLKCRVIYVNCELLQNTKVFCGTTTTNCLEEKVQTNKKLLKPSIEQRKLNFLTELKL